MATKDVKDYAETVLNPEVKVAELAVLVNGLAEDIRAGIAAKDLVADKSNVSYADKATERKYTRYFVRVQAVTDAGIAFLSAKDLAEGDTAEGVRVTFYNAGADAKFRSALRTSIVDGIAGPGKTLTKAASSLDSLAEMDSVTPEMLAALELKMAAIKAKVLAAAETPKA